MARQARGYKGKLRMAFESVYGVVPSTPAMIRLPILSESLDAGRSLNQKDTLRGVRSPGRPFAGNRDASGSIVFAAGVDTMGDILKMICGAPTTTALSSVLNLDAGGAVDKGAGLVGLPCTGHELPDFLEITIAGSSNYDGVYEIQPESTADEIVVRAAYATETFAGTETVTRGAVRLLAAGPAVDKGDGKVGLPCTGHGYTKSQAVTIAGTDNYDGAKVVAESTANELVIVSSYTSETFEGSEAVTPNFYKHAFAAAEVQPSMLVERELDLETTGSDDEAFTVFTGVKANTISIETGGDGQLTVNLETMGRDGYLASATVADSETERADLDFENFDSALLVDGSSLGNITQASMSIALNLDGDAGFVLGSKGKRGSLPEGMYGLSGSISAQVKDTALFKKAQAGTTLAALLRFVHGPHQLDLEYPETRLQEQGAYPKLEGPQGMMQTFPIYGFQDSGDGFTATLINGISSYA